MSIIDVPGSARSLTVVSTFYPIGSPQNPLRLNPGRVETRRSKLRPRSGPYRKAIFHVTVGANSLLWLADTSPLASIPYLIPTKASDPDPGNWTVYKIIPDDMYGYHVGNMEFHGEDETDWHPISWGFEIENLGDFRHPIEERQYIKAALLYAHDCARDKWYDRECYHHSTIAVDHTAEGGRRTDPEAGLWVESIFWDYVNQIRQQWPFTDVPVWWGARDF